MQDWPIALGMFVLTAGGMLATVVWRLRGIEEDLRVEIVKNDTVVSARLGEIEKEHDEKLAVITKEHSAKLEALVSGFRDSFQALREKINEVELNTEREFLSKETFNLVMADIKNVLNRLEDKIDKLGKRSDI